METFCKRLPTIDIRLCKYVFCLILPFLLLPLALSPYKEYRCAYVIVLVASYWLLEPVPIAATALLPVVLLPMVGVLNSTDVCNSYMKESFMMFIGGLIIAIAVEDCMLHERVALKVLLLVGTELKWLMLGFMATTSFLSMWISNTATTAMMVPIVEAVVEKITLKSNSEADIKLDTLSDTSSTESQVQVTKNGVTENEVGKKRKNSTDDKSSIKTALLLCVCYAANVGGTGTLTGTGPNLVFKGLLEELHPKSEEITFATWMMYNIPGLILCVFIAWTYLYVVYVKCSKGTRNMGSESSIKDIILKRYQALGKISFSESAVLVLFVTLVFLWIFRDPKFIMGWAEAITTTVKIGDSVPAMLVAFLLFLIPSNPREFRKSKPLLEWKTVQHKLPWGVIILCGGGFALAEGAQQSGLSALLGNKMSSLSVLPAGAIAAIICFMTAMITEVVTNTTAATILLPVFSQMAITIGVNPLFLMLPVAVTCSYAFMLPVATPPNAIAFDSGHMTAMQMAKPGFIMNFVCCAVQLFMINTLGVAMFNLNEFPAWANNSLVSSPLAPSIFTSVGDITNYTSSLV